MRLDRFTTWHLWGCLRICIDPSRLWDLMVTDAAFLYLRLEVSWWNARLPNNYIPNDCRSLGKPDKKTDWSLFWHAPPFHVLPTSPAIPASYGRCMKPRGLAFFHFKILSQRYNRLQGCMSSLLTFISTSLVTDLLSLPYSKCRLINFYDAKDKLIELYGCKEVRFLYLLLNARMLTISLRMSSPYLPPLRLTSGSCLFI